MKGITILGCKENNLKNIDITIPYSKIVTFVGVSGSGKSTLAFDTLYAEGKRRYVEALGINESFNLSKVKKPDADHFIGLPPTIALKQNRIVKTANSSVGTISQCAYYIQLLFSSCGNNLAEIKNPTPSMFNLNSPKGMCDECGGNGELLEFDETLIWPNQELSIFEGGLKLGGAKPNTTKYNFLNQFLKQFNCDCNTRIKDYPNELKVALLFGQKKNRKFKLEFPGIIPENEKIYKTTASFTVQENLKQFMLKRKCSNCNGTGYNPSILKVILNNKNIAEVMALSVEKLKKFLLSLSFTDYRKDIYNQICKKLFAILNNCINLGIGHLSLNRNATTLSGGEIQRLRLVAQISSELSGVVYILDEPSSGMHPSDTQKLNKVIKEHNSVGSKNTIDMVEHSRELINASDYIFELGPGAGKDGGYLLCQGEPKALITNKNSLTGTYLALTKTPSTLNKKVKFSADNWLEIKGANANNLKDIDLSIPLGCLVCVTGVSGSGKTSLVFNSLYQSLAYKRNINLQQLKGTSKIKNVILCDQSPIGINSRSCTATYSGCFDYIRKLFANTPDAKKAKYTETHFSYNSNEGCCEKCEGNGVIKIDMGVMPDMEVVCDECLGSRYKSNILNIKYHGFNIAEILKLTVDDAINIFKDVPTIAERLNAIKSVGLGYITLGQATSTLSGGECQRLKLAHEIYKANSNNSLIIFDEPSKGLHFEDLKQLISVMKTLIKKGVSIIAVEHNLDIISSADYVIDLGVGAGEHGGTICGQGTPLQISKLNTPTGKCLNNYFNSFKK